MTSQPATTLPIVVTGVGVVSPYGVGLDAFRAGLAGRRPTVCAVTAYDLSRCRARTGACLPAFDPAAFDPSSTFGRVARGTQLSIVATDEALRDAGVSRGSVEPTRLGLAYSSARIAIEKTERFYATFLEKGARLVNPLTFQETVNNAPASHICLRYGITGASMTITSGGVGGVHALLMAAQWLRLGRVDVAVVTAAESMHAASQEVHSHARGHAPVEPGGVDDSRPFDRRRNGYVFGEAAVSFVLETAPHAAARKAAARATLAGCAAAHEGFARGRYHPEGVGLEAAVRTALAAAGKGPSAVGWIFASAQSSQVADRAESRALRRVFGGREASPPVTALKSMVGETEAAAAGLAVAAAIVGMEDGVLYPGLPCEDLDAECDVNLLAEPRRQTVDAALVDAAWFGGGSAAVVVERVAR